MQGFDWDGGNRAKCQKHGVSIAEIEALFINAPRIVPDPKHSDDDEAARGDQCLLLSPYGRKTADASSAR